MQYPSVYGLGSQVRIDPGMKVKPFVFLVRLLQDERLGGYLGSEDLAVPVVYGRRMDDFELCVRKILELRAGKSLRDVIVRSRIFGLPSVIMRTMRSWIGKRDSRMPFRLAIRLGTI